MEYFRVPEILTVQHLGKYMCLPKPNTKKYNRQVRETVIRNSGVGIHSIHQAKVGEAAAEGDIWEAWRRAF